ncbi:metal ABC transporter solute-binding protein, Zn/Mn family [Aestuariivirga litoralis]|uniref:metal ABC transporter solute-binding protein, Zn/Mn family n=1 Tax=Aestuariivirga litoralis TaxID=2650924 RepID=UPI0018C58DEF|nr:zinc ABC transporter substrate-binding protein [Aestuariivirga litoralis]MBG1232598.1 metal ABC transporter substrate-binding protein [Aestuariivirga litoralis]
MKKLILIGLSLAALAAPAIADAKLHVTASFSILGDMVKRVGGDLVDVSTIVGPDADTHVYEPKPADVQLISKSQVLFVNGLGFEGWMTRFVDSSGFKGQVVTVSAGVASRQMEDDGKEITDPHAWQNLANGLIYVRNIELGLCAADPTDCGTFKQNADAYSAEITALDTEVKAAIAKVEVQKRLVITTHDAFGYFGAAYGVKFEAPEGFSTESEAAAGDVAKLITQIKAQHATALFFENMSDPRLIEQIGRETGVNPGGKLFADALSQDEGGGSYLEFFRHNVKLLVAAMSGPA